MPSTRETRLADFARAVARVERETGFPGAVAVAQWAVESGWGERETGAYNYWGIKYNPRRHAAFKEVTTHEFINGVDEKRVERFASYASLTEGLKDYVSLLWRTSRYADAATAYRASDKSQAAINAFIDGIARAGYATAPSYAQAVKTVAAQANVARALAQARQEIK